MMDQAREALFRQLHVDRRLAHETLFPHRHGDKTPEFHQALIDALHSAAPEWLLMAFRGGAKSTRTEEALVIRGAFREFHNCLIVGASERRAVERLTAVKREFEQNEMLRWLFGDLVGPLWQETKIELRGGVVIQAAGRDQNLRGVKHLDWRPDYIVIDDVEDPEAVQSPEGREKTMDWLLAELLPACDPRRIVRMLATPMDADSVPMRLKRRGEWPVLEFPVEYLDDAGERVASWPERYSLEWIERTRRSYEAQGKGVLWEREFMLRPISESSRLFKAEMLRVEPRARRWEATYAMIDPARSIKSTSDNTGWAVWSWVRNRLVIWDADAERLLPDEIVAKAFWLHEHFRPIWIGIEKTGLEQFLSQPVRAEQVRRGYAIPYRPWDAPGQGQVGFIGGALQPYFQAREVVFAKDLPTLQGELLSFPTGRRDAVNALAYAVFTRPGMAIYDGFTEESIASELGLTPAPIYLVANGTNRQVAMQLVQFGEGVLRVVWDGVREGDPGQVAVDLASEASLWAGEPLKAIAPPQHWERYTNVGLVQALHSVPCAVSRGVSFARGRSWLRDRMGRSVRGAPAVLVSDTARWSLNALSGGYCRALDKRGLITEDAEDGVYRVLMEGLEAACGLMAGAEADAAGRNYDYTKTGQRYLSARAHH